MMALARTARVWPRIWREEGHRDGQIELLRARMARKFGEEAAATLERHLEWVDRMNAFVDVDDWISECDTAEELFERTDGLPRRESQ